MTICTVRPQFEKMGICVVNIIVTVEAQAQLNDRVRGLPAQVVNIKLNLFVDNEGLIATRPIIAFAIVL